MPLNRNEYILITHQHTHVQCNHECSNQQNSKSKESPLVTAAINAITTLGTTTAIASIQENILPSSRSGRTLSYPTVFSHWNLGEHDKELEKIIRYGETANIYTKEVLNIHKTIVEGNCAKATGLYQSAKLLCTGAIGAGILQSGILKKSPLAETVTKVAVAISLTSSLVTFLSSRRPFTTSEMPEHYSFGIRHFAEAGVNPLDLPPPYEGYTPSLHLVINENNKLVTKVA